MKFGIWLAALNPYFFLDATLAGEDAGFESVWMSEHLVLPVDMEGSPISDEEHPPIPATTPCFDAVAYLSYLAGRTSRIRLGTWVYLLGLRHPFVSARAFQTLDQVSGGRVEIGVGSGWLESEFDALGVDFKRRGARFDEAIEVCKRLWTEPTIEHHGDNWSFDPVAFEPKPVQQPHPPLHIGGESQRALRRAATVGGGWLGMTHTLETIAPILARLAELRAEHGREDTPFQISVGATVEDPDDLKRWEDLGVDRLIVAPWSRSPDCVEGIRRFADAML